MNIRKAKLSEDDQRYVDANNYLRMLREEYLAHRGATSEDPAQSEGDDPEEDEEDDAVSPEEWVATASKAEIVAELKRRKIDHDPKSSKDDLGVQLLAVVQE